MTSQILPFPVRSRLTPQEREEMQVDELGRALVAALELEFADPEFLRSLSPEQRERMEQSL